MRTFIKIFVQVMLVKSVRVQIKYDLLLQVLFFFCLFVGGVKTKHPKDGVTQCFKHPT